MASTVPANQVVLLASLAAAESAHAAPLRAGVGQADITPRTLVLQRGDRKVALVALDLFMVPGGLLKHVGDALASRGFSESNLLVLPPAERARRGGPLPGGRPDDRRAKPRDRVRGVADARSARQRARRCRARPPREPERRGSRTSLESPR